NNASCNVTTPKIPRAMTHTARNVNEPAAQASRDRDLSLLMRELPGGRTPFVFETLGDVHHARQIEIATHLEGNAEPQRSYAAAPQGSDGQPSRGPPVAARAREGAGCEAQADVALAAAVIRLRRAASARRQDHRTGSFDASS